jgi:alginate O-acetyltransferase complex protein AlgI
MALGTANMLGYKLARNFNMPYLATSVGDYWRRNHISLSTWLRDYLYIPLGGSRGSEWQTCRNLMITMVLGGLWHGASWNFVLWGALHGVGLIVHRAFCRFCATAPRLDALLQSGPGTVARTALTFFFIYQGFVLFRAQSFDLAAAMLRQMWLPTAGPVVQHGYGYGLFWLIVVGFVLFHVAARWRWWERLSVRLSAPALGGAYVAILTWCMTQAPALEIRFIYFQF